MAGVTYRRLDLEACERIREIDPSQFIGRAWRTIGGIRQLVDINYHDSDWPNGYDFHLGNLKATILNGGLAMGAYDCDNRLVGFATVDRAPFGERSRYVLLDQLFVTLAHRNKGIGKRLFMLCSAQATAWHADKLYICAGSAEETIAFYFAIGCTEAKEINQALFEKDTRDLQLEYVLPPPGSPSGSGW